MEKEVRAMLEKGEKVTLIHVQETDKFCIKNKEYEIVDHGPTRVWIIDEEGIKHGFTYKNLKEYFKLKQPKDPNPEKKTKTQRIEELEKIVSDLQKRVKSLEEEKTITICTDVNHREDGVIEVTLHDIQKQAPEFVDIDPEIGKVMNNFKPSYQSPEFWYVDIVEEKDSELLPKFKEWFDKNSREKWLFYNKYYGYSGYESFNGFYSEDNMERFHNSDKMQKITLNEWNEWFNK